MKRRVSTALAGMAISCALCAALWPYARHAGMVLSAQDDPAVLADLQINSALRNNQRIIADNIEQALANGDADLASSFVELARAHNVAVSDELSHRVSEAVADENSSSHIAKRFATGLVTGSADDFASLSGTVTGDLFVIGDIRDVVREGKHLATGEETDRLVLGLATAGLAVTAATYFSAGGAAPVRAGLSLVKDARKVGRLGEGLAAWAGRSARDVVDAPALEQAVASSSVLRPGDSLNAIKAAFRVDKAGGLVRLAKDVGRVTEKTGTRGALDTLKISEGPKDVTRAARLAEAEGGKTRAILKVLGRGALLLLSGAFDLTLWLFSALLALFGVLATIKSTTERATQAWLDHRKARRRRKQLAAARTELKELELRKAELESAELQKTGLHLAAA
jgi:ATP-dependent protease HslVU (ClpYQ) peptidase subunit